MLKRKQHTGFTLIEMLLVIAIIAVLATLSITAYQKRAETTKADKSALQIQQLLQAGLAYYVANNCWPGSAKCKAPVNDFNPYIPVAGTTNPWGFGYTWSEQQNGKLFRVAGETPTTLIAERIAPKLPNASAITVSNKPVVIAEVGQPGSASMNNQRFMVIAKGIISNGQSLPIPFAGTPDSSLIPPSGNMPYSACPEGMSPILYLNLNYFRVDKRKGYSFVNDSSEPIYRISLGSTPSVNTIPSSSYKSWKTNFVFQYVSCGGSVGGSCKDGKGVKNMSGSVTAEYTIACYRPRT